MKFQNLSPIILLFLTITFITCEERRVTLANNIKKNIQNLTMPAGTQNLVNNFANKLTLLFNTVPKDHLTELQSKFDLSDYITNQIKLAPYALNNSLKNIEEYKKTSFYSYEKSLAAAVKEEDGKITFALIKTKTFANLKVRYNVYYTKKCKRFLFFKKCHKIWHKDEKPLTEAEKILIGKALEYTAVKSLSEAVEILKRDDYELYMSDTGKIFSPDHKSVAYITNFGQIAIGPVSELNALYPLEYDYVESFNFATKSTEVTKKISSSYTKLENYPKTKDNQPEDLNLVNGLFHKFNFIGNGEVNKFPRIYSSYMGDLSENNFVPYVLEVKKNGNIILYNKNTNYIAWQSNTANNGTGPYNLHLTNDKKLILEDSTGKIIYQSKNYKETPTIKYAFGQTVGNVTNGYISNTFSSECVTTNKKKICTNASILHIRTNDDNIYTVNYSGKYKGTNNWFTHDNQGNYHSENNEKDGNIDAFKLEHKGMSGYDVCYTARSNKGQWTKIECNGSLVATKKGEYITNLIIYVKESGESVPTINN